MPRIAICLLIAVAIHPQATGPLSPDQPSLRVVDGTKVGSQLVANPERAIRFEITLNAPVDRVWRAWTTRDGIKSFFAPDSEIDLRVFGKYDILFNPSAPVGRRGAENNMILAIQENKMLSFTWDAPPQYPEIRRQRTSVVLRFQQLDKNKTRVMFTQTGWGEGEDWNQAYNYFVRAWGDIVLPFLKYSFEVGPIDWRHPPANVEKAITVN